LGRGFAEKEINAWYQSLGINVPLRGTQLGAIRSIDFIKIISRLSENVNTNQKSVLCIA